ncbi:MAG TPA: hypothetical protein PKV73_00915 [Agriterribacter sp.]|nr:hypothetical protein [Agriterribacter sp.]
MNNDIILEIDSDYEISLSQFIADNTAPDITPIDAEDMEAISKLEIGGRWTLDFGAGGQTFIKRIA